MTDLNYDNDGKKAQLRLYKFILGWVGFQLIYVNVYLKLKGGHCDV